MAAEWNASLVVNLRAHRRIFRALLRKWNVTSGNWRHHIMSCRALDGAGSVDNSNRGVPGTRTNPDTWVLANSIWTREDTCGPENFWIRRENVADSKISGYVWTGPKLELLPHERNRAEVHQYLSTSAHYLWKPETGNFFIYDKICSHFNFFLLLVFIVFILNWLWKALFGRTISVLYCILKYSSLPF